MARKKLERFEENAKMRHVIEPSREQVLEGLSLQGNWGQRIFGNDNPIGVVFEVLSAFGYSFDP